MLVVEESRHRLVHRIQTNDFAAGDQRHSNPVANMFGAGPAFPIGIHIGVGDEDALTSSEHPPHDGIAPDVEGNRFYQVWIAPAFIASAGANSSYPLGITLQQHDIGGVV